jgi:hypothetical protein
MDRETKDGTGLSDFLTKLVHREFHVINTSLLQLFSGHGFVNSKEIFLTFLLR